MTSGDVAEGVRHRDHGETEGEGNAEVADTHLNSGAGVVTDSHLFRGKDRGTATADPGRKSHIKHLRHFSRSPVIAHSQCPIHNSDLGETVCRPAECVSSRSDTMRRRAQMRVSRMVSGQKTISPIETAGSQTASTLPYSPAPMAEPHAIPT